LYNFYAHLVSEEELNKIEYNIKNNIGDVSNKIDNLFEMITIINDIVNIINDIINTQNLNDYQYDELNNYNRHFTYIIDKIYQILPPIIPSTIDEYDDIPDIIMVE
jgi:hypothetical protein